MNSKKRFEGRQLLLVVAIFGIMFIHATSAQDEAIEDASAQTTKQDQATTLDSEMETSTEIVTSETQETPKAADRVTSGTQEASRAGETTTQETPKAADRVTSGTQEASRAGETTTQAEAIVSEVTESDEAATSAEVHSRPTVQAGSAQEHSQSSEAVESSTTPGAGVLSVTLVSTTGNATSEETTESVGQVKEATAENVTSTRETTAIDTTTVGPSDGYNKSCETCHELSSTQPTNGLSESRKESSTRSASLTQDPTKSITLSEDGSSIALPPKSPNSFRNVDKTEESDIWGAHRGLFLTVLILISVCVLVTVVCCLCMAWRRRDKHPDKKPLKKARETPTAVSNPIPDDEMIGDEAPMQERENPAVTPNGGGQHISKADEDNGWVVPLDELSKAEKEKPEVENTRL